LQLEVGFNGIGLQGTQWLKVNEILTAVVSKSLKLTV